MLTVGTPREEDDPITAVRVLLHSLSQPAPRPSRQWLLHALPILAALLAAAWLVPIVQELREQPPLTYPVFDVHDGVAGQPVFSTGTRCSRLSYPTPITVTRQMVNLETGEVFVLPSTAGTASPGCVTVSGTNTVIPERAPTGRYVIHSQISVQGEHRAFLQAVRSAPFKVVGKETVQ